MSRRTSKKDREEFVAVMTADLTKAGFEPNECLAAARAFMKLGSTAGRYAELACDRELTDGEKRRDEANDARVHALATRYGLQAIIGGDPRGFTVKILLPSARWNTMGGKESGWGVPTS